MRYFSTIVLLLAGVLCGYAQPSLFYSSDKLSNSVINGICQDQKGYIWIATEYGLNRFDGYRFTPFLNQPDDSTSLCYNVVCCITCDSRNRLWVGTSKGLQRYDDATGTFITYPFPEGVKPRVSDLFETNDGRLLIGTSGYGLYTLNERSQQLTEMAEAKASENDSFFLYVYEDSRGGLWRGSASNYSYQPKGGAVQLFENCPYGVPTDFMEYQGMTLIICRDGLLAYDDGELSNVPFDTSEAGPNPGFRTAIKDKDGNIFFGTRGNGLFWLPAGATRLQRYPVSVQGYDLNASKIWALTEDRQGNVWVGCQQKGLLMIPERNAQFESWNFAAQRVEIGTLVSSVSEGFNGITWCTVQNKGVYGFNREGHLVSHPDTPHDVEFIYRDKKHQYWLGTSHAVFTFNPTTGSRELLTDFDCDKFNDMTDNGRGTLVFSAFAKGILVYDRNTSALHHYSMNDDDDPERGRLPNDWVMTLMPDHEGRIWIGTSHGVSCFDPQTSSFRPFGWNILAEGKMCYSLCETKEGDILIGLEQGLCIWRREANTLEEFPAKDTPLQSMSISYIVQDNEGDIWCSTINGIWQYQHKANQWRAFISGSGLTGREYITSVGMHNDDDRIFFATADGLTTFTPQQVSSVKTTPGKLLLTGFYIEGHPVNSLTESGGKRVTEKTVDESNYFTVSYLDNSIQLEFSLLNYDNAANTILEHRMSGSNLWTANEAGKNTISLSHLYSGFYNIEVRAIDNGVVSEPMTITIVVRPPWYRSALAYCIYALALLALVFFTVVTWRRRMKLRQDEDKMKFLINATHDIRSPLTLIMGALKKLKQKEADNASVNAIDRNAQRILTLVNQILDIRKIDKQQMHLHCQNTDMNQFVLSIYKVYEYYARERNINFTVTPPSEPHIMAWIDRTQFDKVLSNLLSNAFKYSFDHGSISIDLSQGHDDDSRAAIKDYVEISITDDGVGMRNETVEHLFERFFQGRGEKSGNVVGTGIGLNLCKMIVDMHHGTISGRNRDDGLKGSVFTVRLPLGNDHLSPDEIDNSPDEPTAQRIAGKRQPTSHLHILIADDDEEIPRYIADELSPYYHFTTCHNGKDALKELLSPTAIAADQTYDLVISDVMMPEMDGFTMLHMLRGNVNIAHLPVIMLTSKGDIGNRLEGLEKGADAYLTKPFIIDELHATIDNLINIRQKLRGKYTGKQQPMEKIEKIELKSNDDALMERVIKSINEHMSDSDFNIDVLCNEAGISRAHLHRKMKDMTGISVSEFIRNIRMEQAARLLREQKVNISQVAYSVGYSSLPYFSAVFRKHYGVSPREFIEQSGETPPAAKSDADFA
ncbi:MAG: helix-turn-helix domain-containing protein [Prevotella sp.]|nr:helix-turn-helix domain-containing protein [Prevotella sp.]